MDSVNRRSRRKVQYRIERGGMISARINQPRFGRPETVMEDVVTLEGISLAGISGGQTDDDGVENGSERRWTGRSSGEVGD